MTGSYAWADTEQQASAEMLAIAQAFYLSQTHNSPVSKVIIDEDGKETWSAHTIVEET